MSCYMSKINIVTVAPRDPKPSHQRYQRAKPDAKATSPEDRTVVARETFEPYLWFSGAGKHRAIATPVASEQLVI